MSTHHTFLKFDGILTETQWLDDPIIELNAKGELVAINPNHTPNKLETIKGYALPGFQNSHSHAFQYAIAGTTEYRSKYSPADSFWSWRNQMYQLALNMDPDDFENISTKTYLELAKFGYTSVAEFHYLHYDKSGKNYQNIAELSNRILAAAAKVGIKVFLIPIFFEKSPLEEKNHANQLRFTSTIDQYIDLYENTQKSLKFYKNSTLGGGFHSLRAASIKNITELSQSVFKNRPIHMHIAEQEQEVQQCIDKFQQRPVQLLLNNVELDNFHLVHCTHINDYEVKSLASSRATVVLCPFTEYNLGDGIFPLYDYWKAGGKWSIGTDSHINLDLFAELKSLDNIHRALRQRRNVFCFQAEDRSAEKLFHSSLVNGRLANNDSENSEIYFRKGKNFDASIIQDKSHFLGCTSKKFILSSLFYAQPQGQVNTVFCAGKKIIHEQKHELEEKINQNFVKTIKKLSLRT